MTLRERLIALADATVSEEHLGSDHALVLAAARLALDEAIRECHLDEGDATTERASKRIIRLAATLTP